MAGVLVVIKVHSLDARQIRMYPRTPPGAANLQWTGRVSGGKFISVARLASALPGLIGPAFDRLGIIATSLQMQVDTHYFGRGIRS